MFTATPLPGQNWTTTDEINYLNNIGSYGNRVQPVPAATKLEMLESYMRTSQTKRWSEGCNGRKARQHAQRLIIGLRAELDR